MAAVRQVWVQVVSAAAVVVSAAAVVVSAAAVAQLHTRTRLSRARPSFRR
jgi:hypothetical protein